jgi:multicomponent Na+:H+ antiporter subunit E
VNAAGRVALLVVLWLLAWGELSLANVLSGVVVAAALLVAFPPRRRPGRRVRVHALGALRLAAYVARQLVLSNLLMAREIVRRTPTYRPGVLAHRLQRPSEEIVTLVTSVISLSPGTMTVDVDEVSSTIYVHFYRLADITSARADLARLERLAREAISAPSPSTRGDDPATTNRPKEL